MADADEQPVHEVRPTTQAMKIPARFIPSPTVEPGHTFASVTDHISSIVLRRRMPLLWSIVMAVVIGAGVGIVAGAYPATRAAKLDPIFAMRQE